MPDIFTPEQISQILEEFFKVVGTRQYIGARYVPIFGRKGEESIEWDNTAPYEPLTIVLYQGNSYTSRQFVPVGVEITNQEFWAITGNYNAQVEMYRRETAAAREIADNALNIANGARTDIDTLLPKADFSAENTVKKYVDDSVTEVQTDIDTLLPKADFSAENTVKKYIDSEILRSKKPFVFDTVAEMQNYAQLYAGAICHTNGFHTSGDGGAAYYTIGASGAANGMDVLALQGGLFATLVMSDTINIKQLGAIGNGSTSKDIDQSAFERAAELIFTYTSESDDQNGVCRLYIPNGRYHISEIVLPAGSYVYGDGWQSMIFNEGAFAIEIGGNVTAPRSTVSMINFRGGYKVDLADSKGGLYILNRTQVLIENCWFGANLGICISGSYEVTVDNCTFDLSTQCISVNGGGSIFITNTEFWGTGSTTIASFSDCKKIVFDSCNISSGNGQFVFSNCSNIVISACLRADTLSGITRNPNIYDMQFTDCYDIIIADYISQRTGGGFASFKTCSHVKVRDCIIRYMEDAINDTFGIKLEDCDYANVHNVMIQNSDAIAPYYVGGTMQSGHISFSDCHFIGNAPTVAGASGGSIFCFNTYATNKKMVRCIAEPTNTPDSAVAVVRFSTLNMYDCELIGTYTTGATRVYNNATINNRITPV